MPCRQWSFTFVSDSVARRPSFTLKDPRKSWEVWLLPKIIYVSFGGGGGVWIILDGNSFLIYFFGNKCIVLCICLEAFYGILWELIIHWIHKIQIQICIIDKRTKGKHEPQFCNLWMPKE